jgi:replicative DNA helicase
MQDRVPPHNQEAEQAVVGSLLLDNRCLDRIHGIGPADFYRGAHRYIYAAACEIIRAGSIADIVSVAAALRLTGNLDMSGGAAYVSSLTSSVPSVANIEHYVGIVREQSAIRAMIAAAQQIVDVGYAPSAQSADMIRQMDATMTGLTAGADVAQAIRLRDALHDLAMDFDNARDRSISGLVTEFNNLDAKLGGVAEGSYVVLAARPSVGKTAMALQIAIKNASNGMGGIFWSLEMPRRALVGRVASWGASIPSPAIRAGAISPADLKKYHAYGAQVYDYPLWINDTPSADYALIDRVSRRMVRDNGVRLIVIDYLSLIKLRSKRERHEAVSELSHDLKSLARDTGAVVLVLSQLTRDSEDRRPSLRDIRESGAIEQDADIVILLHALGKHGDELRVDAIVAKNREGQRGDAELLFDGNFVRFRDF